MVKVPAPKLTPFDLLAIAKTPGIRIAYTPFGEPPGSVKYYIGESVDWKGFKKGAETIDEYLKRFAETFGDTGTAIAKGLRRAIEISKDAHETYGVAIVELAPGTPVARMVTLPLKVVKQMQATKKIKPQIIGPPIEPGKPAKVVRQETGVKGEYKSLLFYRAYGGASPVLPL
jgi:hypothetical protein